MVRQRFDEDNRQPHLATAFGTLYEAQTRYGDAVNAYRQAIELDPNDIVALNNIALLWRTKATRNKPTVISSKPCR